MVPRKKRGPAPTGKGTQIQVRLHEDLLDPLDGFRWLEGDDPNRPEAIRRVLKNTLPEKDQPLKPSDLSSMSPEENAAINAYYASSAPGVGAHFLRAMINHLRSELRSNPDITVDEVKEFVLDMFDDYGQPLDE